SFLKETFDGAEIASIWREDAWDNVKGVVEASDLIVFACLAIRKNMTIKEYPYLWNIISSDKKIIVLASGTNLSSGAGCIELDKALSPDTTTALQQLAIKASVFSSRGYLTHWLLHSIGVAEDVFTGDIAFYDKRFIDRQFKKIKSVKRIAVSDPHSGKVY